MAKAEKPADITSFQLGAWNGGRIAGLYYLQEPSAMTPAYVLPVEPGDKVLDLCAAPGGKTTDLAASLREAFGDDFILVSNEVMKARAGILAANVAIWGDPNVAVTSDDPSVFPALPGYFDIILADVPCSGEGMFRKEDIAIDEWNNENVLMCAKRSAEILENAVKTLKSGGYIVYATCTFSLEENEMTVDWFLKNHPDFELVRVKKEVEENTCDGVFFDGCTYENINFARRFYPHKNRGEGQFMAVLHNKNDYYGGFEKPKKKADKIDKTVFDFLDDTLTEYNKENVLMHKGTPIYFTPDFDMKNVTAFSVGVTIGEIKKNYIQPHHQFFMAMGKDFKRKINLTVDCDETKKYLHGEEIETNCPNGWAVVTVNGCALGGAKVVSGVAKNHYPKGLRLANI